MTQIVRNLIVEGFDANGATVQKVTIIAESYKDVTIGQFEAVEGRLLYLVRNMHKDPLIQKISVEKA